MGLLILTDDGRLQQRISDPRHKQPKLYRAQVEGIPDATALGRAIGSWSLDGLKPGARVDVARKIVPAVNPRWNRALLAMTPALNP